MMRNESERGEIQRNPKQHQQQISVSTTNEQMKQPPQMASRDIKDTTSRITQAMNELQQANAQKTNDLKVAMSKLQETTSQNDSLRRNILELQVTKFLFPLFYFKCLPASK